MSGKQKFRPAAQAQAQASLPPFLPLALNQRGRIDEMSARKSHGEARSSRARRAVTDHTMRWTEINMMASR